jgi:hypothetical protein
MDDSSQDPDQEERQANDEPARPDQGKEKAGEVLRAELQVPQAVIDRYDTNQQQHGRTNRRKFWLDLATLLAVLGYASVAAFPIIIENTGRSPAQDVRVVAHTSVRSPDWAIPDHLPEAPDGTRELSISVIGPAQTQTMPFRRQAPLTEEQVGGIKQGVVVLYFVADVIYRDQFNQSRELKFCFFYPRSIEGDTITGLRTCRLHNSVR